MKLCRLAISIGRSHWSKAATIKNIRLGIVIICFSQFFLPSRGFSQSPSATSLCNMPSARGSAIYNRYCGGGAGGYVAPQPQPYVAPQPSPAQKINDEGNAAYKEGNFALAERLYAKALASAPNDAVIAQNLRNARAALVRNKAVGVNNQAVEAENADNWDLAVNLLEQAQKLDPHNSRIWENLYQARQHVRAKTAQDLAQQDEHHKDQIASANMLETTRELADSLKQASPSSSNPDVNPAPANRVASGSTESIAPNSGTGTALFGAKSNPPNLDFVGIDMNRDAAGKPRPVESTMDALKSAAQSGADANKTGISEEAAKAKSGCQFDDKACANYVPNPPVRVVLTQSPAATGLADRIRKATSDPAMAANLQWYLDLDRQVLDKQADIAAVQKEIDRGGGDAAILNAHKKSLESDLARSKTDQVNVVRQMKDQSEKLNIHIDVDWNAAVSK